MAEVQLTIINANDKEVYCNDTTRIHPISSKLIFLHPTICHPFEEFSLLDDAYVKCRPYLVYDKDIESKYCLEIEFTTPVPKANKYEISLYYFHKLGQLKFANVLNAENIEQDDKFTLPCNGAFVIGNVIEGNIILCSRIRRKESLNLLEQKSVLQFSQINDCSLLFENAALSNLTISVENREFKVHKEILAAKSSVFLAMFETEMKENYVKIEDIEANIFQEFLRCIYTNTVNDLNIHAEKLYKVADKYDLSNLKLICINELSRSLNVKNAINMFLFADENNETVLKEITLDFIKKHVKLIFQTEGYKALCQSPEAYLIDEIFRATLDHVTTLK